MGQLSGELTPNPYTPKNDFNTVATTEKRNLLLIAKEAINNSIKYSGCRTMRVECSEENNGIYLCIEDDGKGFDTGSPSIGNGLRNMTERARQINFTCKIISSPESGTRILISKQ